MAHAFLCISLISAGQILIIPLYYKSQRYKRNLNQSLIFQGNDIIRTGKWLYQGRRKSSSAAVASSSSFFVASVAEEAFSSGFMLSKRR